MIVKDLKDLNFLISVRFFIYVTLIILIFFNFLDIFLFELSRSFPGLIFNFFKEVIDPISDILDPLNFIILFSMILFVNLNVNSLLNGSFSIGAIRGATARKDVEPLRHVHAGERVDVESLKAMWF